MPINIDGYEELARRALATYWQTLVKQKDKQTARDADRGNRAAVTGGQQMNGFGELVRWVLVRRLAYERVGRGCIVSTRRGEEPRYATVTELAARLGPEEDMLMLLTAISDAVERYNPEKEAVVMIDSEKGFEVSIVSSSGTESVGGLLSED